MLRLGLAQTEVRNYERRGNKKHVVLFKLHGSARWVKRGSNTSAAISYLRQKTTRMFSFTRNKKGSVRRPLFHGLRLLPKDNGRLRCCIVIGYSFRDYDALTKLASASAFNPRLKVLVVDPNLRTSGENFTRKASAVRLPARRSGKTSRTCMKWPST